QRIVGIDRSSDVEPLARGVEIAGAKMREPRVRDVGGLPGTEGGGAVEEPERIPLRAGCKESHAKLVHDVGLLRREVEGATERARRGDERFLLSRDQAEAEVGLPDLRIELEDALERGADLIESRC